jgi:hypothetical protein
MPLKANGMARRAKKAADGRGRTALFRLVFCAGKGMVVIMETFAEFVAKLIELFNKEFAVVRKKLLFLALAIGMVLVAVFVVGAGVILVVIGIYKGLSLLMLPFLAAFVTAVLMFIVGGGMLLCARLMIR